MPQVRVIPPEQLPELYRRIGFDAGLESVAFRRLVELDLEGCRSAFGRLIDRLDLRATGAEQGEMVARLLLDILQQVNRRVHRASSDDGSYQIHRMALIEEFATYQDSEDARHAFMPALNRLLAPLGRRALAAHPLAERAQTYIEENYHRRISLSTVASHLHVSPNYLSRIFKKEAGATLTSYTHTVRLEHATLLLAAGERSISEIAYLVGYQNYRDFYRNFVKYKNASPRQVRRRLSPRPAGA